VDKHLQRIVLLISGRGSNMQAIVGMLHDRGIASQACAVISNRPDAAGLAWAREHGLATQVVDHRTYPTRAAFDQALGDAIAQHAPDYVLLAGFMRILTPGFVARFAGKLINIHPSLLPLFPGLHTHQQALDAGVRWHGCTVHVVTEALDHGPIIAQGVIPVHAGDTAQTLAQRLLPLEHAVYAQVAQWLIDARVSVDGEGKVLVAGAPPRAFVLSADGGCVQELS